MRKTVFVCFFMLTLGMLAQTNTLMLVALTTLQVSDFQNLKRE